VVTAGHADDSGLIEALFREIPKGLFRKLSSPPPRTVPIFGDYSGIMPIEGGGSKVSKGSLRYRPSGVEGFAWTALGALGGPKGRSAPWLRVAARVAAG